MSDWVIWKTRRKVEERKSRARRDQNRGEGRGGPGKEKKGKGRSEKQRITIAKHVRNLVGLGSIDETRSYSVPLRKYRPPSVFLILEFIPPVR